MVFIEIFSIKHSKKLITQKLFNLLARKYLQCSIDITTEQSFKYMKSPMQILNFKKCVILADRVTCSQEFII